VAHRLSVEELMHEFGNAGFELLQKEFHVIPYMASPASAHYRMEKVLCFCARKVKECESPAAFEVLPEWLQLGNLPVPLLPVFQQFFNEHRTYAQMFSVVDGKRSLNEIASILSNLFSISQAEAHSAFVKIAMTLYEKQGSDFLL
jgi:hypothetical protein